LPKTGESFQDSKALLQFRVLPVKVGLAAMRPEPKSANTLPPSRRFLVESIVKLFILLLDFAKVKIAIAITVEKIETLLTHNASKINPKRDETFEITPFDMKSNNEINPILIPAAFGCE
jgi:hypothetical protein